MTFQEFLDVLFIGFTQTVCMITMAGLLGVVVGGLLGTIVFATQKDAFFENLKVHKVLKFVFNAAHSLPFFFLMLLLIPLTRWIAGTSDGTHASIIPLGLGVAPFIARLVESVLNEVPKEFIEIALCMGARPVQIIRKVLWRESLPNLIRGMTAIFTSLVGYSAMVGTIGGGGLGEVAIRFGYQRFDIKVMVAASILLILLSQVIQWIGGYLAKKVDHRFT